MQVVVKTTQVVDNIQNCKECPLVRSFDSDDGWSSDGKIWVCGITGMGYNGMYGCVPEECPAKSEIIKETEGKKKTLKIIQVRK